MEEENDSRKWDDLIPDALGLIFKKLSLFELLNVVPVVCKSWKRVVLGPYCWQKIDLEEWIREVEWAWVDADKIHRMLQLLLPRSCGSLQELSVCGDLSDESVVLISKHAQSLRTLRIRECGINDKMIEMLAPMLSNITCLDLYYTRIGRAGLQVIGQHCQHLEHLDITGCSDLDFDEELWNRFSNLKIVRPAEVNDFSDDSEYDDIIDDMVYDDYMDDYLYDSGGYGSDGEFLFGDWFDEDEDEFDLSCSRYHFD